MFDGTARVQRDLHDWDEWFLFWKIETLVQDGSIFTNRWGIQGFIFFYKRYRLEGRWKTGSEPWTDTALYLHSRYVVQWSDHITIRYSKLKHVVPCHQRKIRVALLPGKLLIIIVDKGSYPNGQNSAEQIVCSDPKRA